MAKTKKPRPILAVGLPSDLRDLVEQVRDMGLYGTAINTFRVCLKKELERLQKVKSRD